MNGSRTFSRLFSLLVLAPLCSFTSFQLTASTATAQQVRIQLELTDIDANLVDVLTIGETYVLRGTAEQLEEGGQGVFATYLDIAFDKNLVEVAGDVTFSDWFPNGQTEMVVEPGLFNDIGGFGGLQIQPELRRPIFEVPIIATDVGTISFTASEPGRAPFTDTLVYMNDEPIIVSEIEFVGATAQAVPEPTSVLGLWLCLIALRRSRRR